MPSVVPSAGDPTSAADESVASGAVVDGRLARAQRTRRAIVDALLGLLSEDGPPPTANRIAERAGISPRLIYHHFGDLESLFGAVAERQAGQIAAISEPIPPDLPLPERLDALLDQRIAILELLTPVRRAVLLHEQSSTVIRAAQRRLRAAGRVQVEHTFAPELAKLAGDERAVLINAIEGVLAWGFWNDLIVADLDQAAARASIRAVLAGLLVPLA